MPASPLQGPSMVEGDLVDLSLSTLLQARAREGSTAMLRLQHGTDQGTLYFCEGALIHAASGPVTGDEAVLTVLGWGDGRFRIVRDVDRQPRTITRRISEFIASDGRSSSQSSPSNGNGTFVPANPDEE